MNFQFSSGIDENKIFLVMRSELEGRIDPMLVLYQRSITQFQYRAEKLSSLLKCNPQYGANETGIERRSLDEPRYIRITDIDEYGLLKPEIGKTAERIESQYLLKDNDLLFARSGTVGKAYIHKTKEVMYPCFYAGYMIKFVVDEEKVNPDYIFAYTQLETYNKWVKAIQRVAAQPNINAEEYKSLQIPIPPKEVQSRIVAKMDAAYFAKRQKEEQAQRLLDSIDDYLLGELGIELPEQEENTLQSRIFIRQLSEVSGGRLDPHYYLHIEKIIGHLSTYGFSRLNHLIQKPPQYGANETAIDGDENIDTRYIRITDINEVGELNPFLWKTAKIIEKQYLLNHNDLLFARSGSVGMSLLT